MVFCFTLVIKKKMTNVKGVNIMAGTCQKGIENAREMMFLHQDAEWAMLLGDDGILQTWGSPVIRVNPQ